MCYGSQSCVRLPGSTVQLSHGLLCLLAVSEKGMGLQIAEKMLPRGLGGLFCDMVVSVPAAWDSVAAFAT